MPDANPAALDFLLTRQSVSAKTLRPPVPSRAELETMLTAAARVPDHGGLAPWRFIVLERPALERLARIAAARGAALGYDAEKIGKGEGQFARSSLAVAVIASPATSEKATEVEQTLSTGAACVSLVNAALASGWGAAWITGWPAFDRGFAEEALSLAPQEWVAGFVHMGTPGSAVGDRPRPALDRIVTWVAA